MSVTLMVVVTFIYCGVAIEQLVLKNWPMAIVFIGYAFANIGFIIGMSK